MSDIQAAEANLRHLVAEGVEEVIRVLRPYDDPTRKLILKLVKPELELRYWAEVCRLDPEGYREYAKSREPQPPPAADPTFGSPT